MVEIASARQVINTPIIPGQSRVGSQILQQTADSGGKDFSMEDGGMFEKRSLIQNTSIEDSKHDKQSASKVSLPSVEQVLGAKRSHFAAVSDRHSSQNADLQEEANFNAVDGSPPHGAQLHHVTAEPSQMRRSQNFPPHADAIARNAVQTPDVFPMQPFQH